MAVVALHVLDEVIEEQVEVFGGTRVKPQLVNEQLGRVEHARGLGEEILF